MYLHLLYLSWVLVNQGSSPREGTAASMRWWDLMKDRVSTGMSRELLKDAAGPWPAQDPGLEWRGGGHARTHAHTETDRQRERKGSNISPTMDKKFNQRVGVRRRCFLGSQKDISWKQNILYISTVIPQEWFTGVIRRFVLTVLANVLADCKKVKYATCKSIYI